MAPPVTRSSSDSRASTAASDPILQAINVRLISITQDLTDIRNDVIDLKVTITSLKKEILTIEELTEEQRNYDERLDRLTLKIADTAVEFTEFQQRTEERLDTIVTDPMTFTPTILTTVNAAVDNKIQNLSTLVNQELQNSTYLQHLQKSNQSFINHTIDNSPTISNLLRSVQDLQSSHHPSTIPTRPSGFHQPESKDFHVSCLLKLLDTVNLASDSLQDLETFHVTIQSHFSTVSTSSNIFPKYKNLTPTFNFQDHLCCPKLNPHLKPSDLNQSLLNFDTFGSGLRQFILNPKTIPQTTAPDSYLQLLSLRHESDGFLLYQNFIFLCSPQLEGKFIDYRAEINKLSIVNEESIRSFYSRVIWLYNELQLARIQDGSLAVLFEHFLTLLRSTGDHVILAETSNTWKQIKTHRRMPNYMTQPLPLTLNQVLRDLEIANVTNLYLPNHYQSVAPSSTDNIPDSMALKDMQFCQKHRPNIPSS
jgi:hypothetical protein